MYGGRLGPKTIPNVQQLVKKRLQAWKRYKVKKHKRETTRWAKADRGASKEFAARNENSYLIIKCAANIEEMQNTIDAKQENTFKRKTLQ